ncbi:MAG TPA: SpoVR family protein [Phycisphaerales bacterium]|nr:SpoVR family protein [Phycisphaerales bacterium]
MITRRASNTDLPAELRAHMERIKAKANEYGLVFPEVIYEVLDFETMNQIAAYGGFAVRYPHWRWGMEFERLSKRDAYGLGRIYEMVINNDPVYAYLQESNSVTDQKLVMAHVYGHADFFFNNFWFSKTDRKMMNTMANHATRVMRHIEHHGQDAVERFVDLCLSVEHLIDPHSVFSPQFSAGAERDRNAAGGAGRGAAYEPSKLPAKSYMDPFVNPRARLDREKQDFERDQKAKRGRFPAEPARDVLLFMMHHAPLEDWQQDVLSIIRDESYYFAPQAMTKVMNEGWATYWHSKLMTEHFLEAAEIVDYAEQHSGVVHMPPGGFNPYKIGVELWKDIERRWNTGQHGPAWERLTDLGDKDRFDDKSMKGREKIFEIRRIYNDVSFIDEFLTEEFVERHKMFRFRRDPQSGETRVVSRDFEQIKQTLLYRITNMGQPFIYVVDGNYLNRGELYLAHQWNGLDIDLAKASDVLKNLRLLWGRPVHLQARLDDDMQLLSMVEPEKPVKKEKITDSTPRPANEVR